MSRLIIHIGMPKTATSSIQETLFASGGLGDIKYAALGRLNHGGIITSLFGDSPGHWRGHRLAQRSLEEIEAYNSQALTQLEAVRQIGGQQLISGEEICHLPESALIRLRKYFSSHFDSIQIVGYVRPPASFMVSAFQQKVKNHGLGHLTPNDHYPRYRQRFEKFDSAFGKKNVTLWLFDPKRFVGGDAVMEFCHLLGESINAKLIKRVNESLSLEATAVLFAIRNFGASYTPNRARARHDNALVNSLSGFGSRKLRFAHSLLAPVLNRNRNDIAWMEARLGEPIDDGCSEHPEAIISEEHLLQVAVEELQALDAYVQEQAARMEPAPAQLAHWVEKLRVAAMGRKSSSIESFSGEARFFTTEQMKLLENERLGPAVALRELANAFEQQGQLQEANAVISAAVKLRPDAMRLKELQARIRRKLEASS
jgi:hypothetical protein